MGPYQKIAMVTLFLSFLISPESRAAYSLGCESKEPWGSTQYFVDEQSGIYVHIRLDRDDSSHLARFIPTDPGVKLCFVVEDALVYVMPGQGVYQVDRNIDAENQAWMIGDVPDHYSDQSEFQWRGDELILSTGPLWTAFTLDVSVRNDVAKQISPRIELPTYRLPSGQTELTDGPRFLLDGEAYEVRHGQVLPMSVREVTLSGGRLSITTPEGTLQFELNKEVKGICETESDIVVFDGQGTLVRYAIEDAALSNMGEFDLSTPVTQCAIDPHRKRLYVVNNELVIWAFDLSESGLTMPRAVTTDQATEAFYGLTLYGSDYVISQSLGDHAILVFETEQMSLLARFKVKADLTQLVDGITVSGVLGAVGKALPGLPSGALIVYDPINRLPDEDSNIKVMDWRDVESQFPRK